MTLIETLNQIWTQILDVTSIFVMPDWGFLIGFMPVLIVLGLVGPFLTALAIGTVIYLATKPRIKVAFVEGPQVAQLGAGGEPVFPVGLPHCRRHALVYASGTQPLRHRRRPAVRGLPDVRARPPGIGRHLHQLRSRPQGQAPRRGGPQDIGTEARRRGRRRRDRDATRSTRP